MIRASFGSSNNIDSLLKSAQINSSSTDSLLKLISAYYHSTSTSLVEQHLLENSTDALLFALYIGTGNITFNTLAVNGQTKYEGPGQGIFAFEEIRISGFGVFTPVYKPSTQEIEFQQIDVKGTGLFVPPVPRITTRDVYKINRGVLARDYGWGVYDITLGYEWSDYCPGGEGAHSPLIGPCADRKGFIDSIYGINPDVRGVNWYTCPPPCQPIPSMGVPAPSVILEPQQSEYYVNSVPIVHKLEDITSLKADRVQADILSNLPTEITARPKSIDIGITIHKYDEVKSDQQIDYGPPEEPESEIISENFLRTKSDKIVSEVVEDKYTQPKHRSRTIDIGIRNAPKLQEKSEPKLDIQILPEEVVAPVDTPFNQEIGKKSEVVAVLEPTVKKSFNIGLRNKKRR